MCALGCNFYVLAESMLFELAEEPLKLVGAPSVCQIAITRVRFHLIAGLAITGGGSQLAGHCQYSSVG